MIASSHKIAGHEFFFERPHTTADVLDWLAWAKCRPTHAEQVHAAISWAAQWVIGEGGARELAETLKSLDGDVGENIIELCDAIVETASVPQHLLDQALLFRDRQNDIDKDWKPEPQCGCDFCRAVWRGVDHPEEFKKPGQPCINDGIDPQARLLLQHIDEADMSAPYYVTQVRQVAAMAQSRKWLHDEEVRKCNARLKGKSAELYGG